MAGDSWVFAELVRSHRRRLGLTQEELAAEAGVNVRSIGKIEAGRVIIPRPATVRLLAGAFGLSGPDRDRFLRAAAAATATAEAATAEPATAEAATAVVDATTTLDVPIPGAPVPAQLPADIVPFTGRTEHLDELDRVLAARGEPGSVTVATIAGTAGVGKTALAVRWAHRVRGRFPDGQLYVNLRGYDPDVPVSAGDALAGFLRALGMPGQQIPLDVEERAGAYRSLLAGRRMLVVLDNASTVEQIRPLLPGTPACMTVVTSRDSLPALVARHGAHRIELDLLPPSEAVALLRALVGARVDAEPDPAADLAGQCARLPLALRLAAELAVARPTTPVTSLVAELADQRRRLDALDAGGDPRTAVRAVFSWSYQHLPAPAASAFRLLGLHPGPDIDPYATAALIHSTVEAAHHLLDVLTRAHLIQPTGDGRFGIHDLLRAYAMELATVQDADVDRRAALTRLFDHYLATAGAALDTLYPAERHRRPRARPATTPTAPVHDPGSALAWLNAQRPVLVTAVAHTAAKGWPGRAVALATTLFRYLDTGGHAADALTIHTHARHAAGLTGDRAGVANALIHLGGVHWQQGRHELAIDHVDRATVLFRAIGDRTGQARALNNLGVVHFQLGRYPEAVDQFQQALTLFRETGDRTGEARGLTSLGVIYDRQGRYDLAVDHHERAIAIYRAVGHQGGQARGLTNLGVARSRQGRYEEAVDHLRQAQVLGAATGHRRVEGYALTYLGEIRRRQGRYPDAVEHLERALRLFRETGDLSGEAEALNTLGDSLLATGQQPAARIRHTAALALAVETDDGYQQARAHSGLAATCEAGGRPDQARQHWRQALLRYTHLGVPEAGEVRARLAAPDTPTTAALSG